VTNVIHLRWSLLLPVDAVNCVQTLKDRSGNQICEIYGAKGGATYSGPPTAAADIEFTEDEKKLLAEIAASVARIEKSL
jgi:hypothetical protein